MLDVILLGKIHQTAMANDIEIGAARLKSRILGGIQQFEVTDELALAQLLDLAGSGKAVKHHLPQVDQRVVAVPRRVGRGVASWRQPFATDARRDVNLWQEATPGNVDLLPRLAKGMPARLHFGVPQHRDLRRLRQ
jgi:hypothetical protein